MSDHDFDEDHNYYTQSNRQSQIPDYDVTQQPLSTNLPTLPAFAYRQSQHYTPKRPTIDTNVDQSLANGPNPSRSRASSQLDNSPDPHEFYRQYRDSFIRNTGSVYGTLDTLQADGGNGMTAARLAQRNTPPTNRPNGYTPPSVTSRWSNRFEDRNASSPLADRGSISGSKTGTPNVYIPRGRQTSLQALVNKFNSNPDETPPVPGSRTSSRSTSANSPSSNVAPKSFRTRASIESSQPPQNVTPSRNSTRQPQGFHNAVNRKKENREPPTSSIKSPKNNRRSSAITTGTFGSLSMSDLNTPATQKTRRPLFGEILQASANASDPGYGIPDGRRRRGSEGSMHHPSPMFEEEAENLMLKVSPSSPTAWYMGVAPSLDGLDLDKPLPPRSSGMHRRSRSDIGASGGYTMAPLPSTVGKTITVLPAPQEQDSPPPTSPTTSKRTSQSRIPISTRRMSFTSDSGTSTVSPGPQQASASGLSHPPGYRRSSNRTGNTLPTSVPPKTPDNPSSRSATPRKSPRYRNASPPRQPSPRLPAYISEQAPLKSPPLRSSRPRQPVSAASTAASRARAAANSIEQGSSQKEKPPKKIPEVGTVNLAARRQMITRAFTKSMIEREEETRKRLSYFHEMKKLEELQAKRSAASSNAHSESDDQPSSDFATPAEELSRAEGGLTIDTQKSEKGEPAFFQEDSPTLGTSGFVNPQGVGSEPGSAVTSDTAETFFDESQESPAEERKDVSLNTRASGPPTTSPLDRNDHDTPRRANRSVASDKDDGESIQIMLGDSPIMERLRAAENFADLDESPTDSYDQWQNRATQSTLERISEQNTPQTDKQAHSSMSTTVSVRDEQPWSPDSVSSLLSGNTTLDSESYNTIGRVLDAYYDPGSMSPENMNEFQRRLFAQSPGIARAGGWDPSKVTQLYLQKYRKSPDLSAVPKRLNVQSGGEDSLSTPQGQEEGATREADEGEDSVDRLSSKEDDFNSQSRTASLTVPSATMNLNRASLNNPEDWLNTSPSMLDWINRQAMDTPADEREDSLGTRIPSGTGGLKDPQGRSILPDIPQGGLGILDVAGTPGQSQAFNDISQPPPSISEIYTSPSRRLNNLDKPLPSPTRKPVQPRTSSVGQTRPLETIDRVQNGDTSSDTPLTPKRMSGAESSTTEVTENERPSISSEAPTKASSISTEQLKKLTKRKHIIKELVDTESSFGQDMTVVVDIYKGTSQVILSSPEDVKALFGNAHDIVTFSMNFLDSLKTSAKSVYVLPKSKRWKSKRDSSATTESNNTDDQGSTAGADLGDEDRDRMTTVGAAFLENIEEMEKVYTEYLKNHDSANRKLQQLQKLQKVQIWLKECRAYAHDLTTAWDLDSLLVKPVQRVLKYPLLLKELVEVTPDNHPDFIKLDTAARELVGVSKRINDAKKRADLVEQVTGATKTKKKEESRLGLPKAFGRRNEKLKQQVGLVENFQDREYDEVSQKFGSHYFQVQVVMRDVEMYQEMVKRWVGQFIDFATAIDQYIGVNTTTYPELESKWKRFSSVARDMQGVALEDHTEAVKKNVIDPMTSLLKLHDGPQKLMEKRKKRVADFVKYKALKDRGEKPDKKTIEQGEQFLAVNDTLKIELPKLFSLTGRLVEACLNNFVQLQLQWTSVWKRKMIQAIQLQEVPVSFGVIAQDFAADFRYIEAQVLSLGVCNGSILADAGSLLPFGSSGPSIGGTTLHENGSRRPSLTPDEYRPRALSNVGAEHPRGRGLSTPGGASPMLPSPDFGRPSDGFGLTPQNNTNLAQPATGLRVRASSSASSKSPVTPDIPGGWRNQMNGPPIAGSHGNRPSTSTGRSYGSFSGPAGDGQRYSSEPQNRPRSDRDNPRFMAPSHPGQAPAIQRHSGIFSSAMPMSDSPRPSSPTNEDQLPQDYNVLFLAASVYEFNIDRARREGGYPYLTYVAGEIFDVIGEKGELWLAKNQDDEKNQIGWIWNKHFAKLAS